LRVWCDEYATPSEDTTNKQHKSAPATGLGETNQRTSS